MDEHWATVGEIKVGDPGAAPVRDPQAAEPEPEMAVVATQGELPRPPVAAADPGLTEFVITEPPASPHWLWMITMVPGVGNPLSIFITVCVMLVSTVTGLSGIWHTLHGFGAFVLSVFFLSMMGMLIVPNVLLMLGAVTILFPARRCARVEAEHTLEAAPAGIAQLDEVAAFVHARVPSIELRTNLLRLSEQCFIYPAAPKQARLAVFGGLIRLWTSDRPAAEAVLLHELAHYTRGDYLLLGVGAGFERAVRVGTAAAVFCLALVLLFIRTGPSAVLLLFWCSALVQTTTAIVLAVWSCELTADHLALVNGAGPALATALEAMRERGTPLQRFLARFSHPPQALRLWLANKPEAFRIRCTDLLFPLGLLARDTLVLLLLIVAVYAIHPVHSQMKGVLTESMTEWLVLPSCTGLIIGVFMLFAWPRIYPRITRNFFIREKFEPTPLNTKRAWASAGVMLALWLTLGIAANFGLLDVFNKRAVWSQRDQLLDDVSKNMDKWLQLPPPAPGIVSGGAADGYGTDSAGGSSTEGYDAAPAGSSGAESTDGYDSTTTDGAGSDMYDYSGDSGSSSDSGSADDSSGESGF